MRITEVRSKGFKRDDLTLVGLPAGLVVVGDNGEGKSAIGEAAEIALTGLISGGRYAKATAIHQDYVRDGAFHADIWTQAAFNGGAPTVTRWIGPRGKDGKVTQGIGILGEEHGAKKGQGLIDEYIDAKIIKLEIGEFADLSEDKQIKRLFELVAVPEKYSRENIEAKILKAELMSTGLFEAWPPGMSTVEGLSRVLDKIRKDKNARVAEAKKATAIKDTIDDMQSEVYRLEEDAATIKKKVEAKLAEKAVLDGKLAAADAIRANRETWQKSKDALELKLTQAKEKPDSDFMMTCPKCKAEVNPKDMVIALREASLREHETDKPKAVPTTDIKDALLTIIDEYNSLNDEYDEKAKARTEKNLAIEAEVKRQGLQGEIEQLESLYSFLGPKGIMGEALTESLTPMLEIIGRYLIEGDEPEVSIDDDGNFRVGMRIEGSFRSINSLSASQRAEFAAAVGIAFAQGAKFNLMLADNLELFDTKRSELFVMAMRRAIDDGVLDNFIGFSSRPIPQEEGGILVLEYAELIRDYGEESVNG